MKQYVQDPPTAMQVELTEGCNLRCPFCGLNGIRGKEANFKFMDLLTAEVLAQGIADAGWRCRIEFAMHGEPTLNKDAARIIATFRRLLPATSLMMTSNGGGLLRGGDAAIQGNIRSLFVAGLDILALDDYEHSGGLVPRILAATGVDPDTGDPGDLWAVPRLYVARYPDNPEGNPHRPQRGQRKLLTIIRDISLPDVRTGTHAKLNNHAGSGAPLNHDANGKRCAKPFREMSVRWDGNVAICCNDWRGEYKCGNVRDEPVAELWQNDAFRAARHKLYHGQRDFGACLGCDATSYRVGLLPDRMGKDTLPLPDAHCAAAIQEACAGAPYTAPVLRPWEQETGAGAATPTARLVQLQRGR